jgi:hypothetical protein
MSILVMFRYPSRYISSESSIKHIKRGKSILEFPHPTIKIARSLSSLKVFYRQFRGWKAYFELGPNLRPVSIPVEEPI